MPRILYTAWRWFIWFSFFNRSFLRLIIALISFIYFLGFLDLIKFCFSKIAFKLKLSLNKRLIACVIILFWFNLIIYGNWTFWNRRIGFIGNLLFNWSKMALSNIVLIIWCKCLYCLIIFLLLWRWYFEVLIVIFNLMFNIYVITWWLILFKVLIFVHQTKFVILFLNILLIRIVLDWWLWLSLNISLQSEMIVCLLFI